ncbi:MAG: PepSY domain-containing protein [Deltaproteobacteria bacterium]|nr:PepSY domain-containing protein [Deltaproteobacteria bacterium]
MQPTPAETIRPPVTQAGARGAQEPTRRVSRRALWLTIHLYLGLWAGAVLAVAGLTGSILVFWHEIDEWLNSAPMTIAPVPGGQLAYRPLEEMVAAATAALPQGAKPGVVEFPRHAQGVVTIFAQGPATNPDDGDTLNVFVNPYTAQVTGTRKFYSATNPLRHSLIGFVFKLHYALLLWDTGMTVLGIVALFLIVEVMVGVILWWPPPGKWWSALAIKREASAIRLTYDLHKTAGAYSGFVLLVVLLSGVYMNLPTQFLWAVQYFSPGTRGEEHAPTSTVRPGVSSIGVDRAVAAARAQYPGGQLYWVALPSSEAGIYTVSFTDVPGLSHFWSERQVSIDQYRGTALDVRGPDSRRTAGETFIAWQWPLHSGRAFGMPGRLVVFLIGLACPVLYITGFIRWRQKRRTAKFHNQRVAQLGQL